MLLPHTVIFDLASGTTRNNYEHEHGVGSVHAGQALPKAKGIHRLEPAEVSTPYHPMLSHTINSYRSTEMQGRMIIGFSMTTIEAVQFLPLTPESAR